MARTEHSMCIRDRWILEGERRGADYASDMISHKIDRSHNFRIFQIEQSNLPSFLSWTQRKKYSVGLFRVWYISLIRSLQCFIHPYFPEHRMGSYGKLLTRRNFCSFLSPYPISHLLSSIASIWRVQGPYVEFLSDSHGGKKAGKHGNWRMVRMRKKAKKRNRSSMNFYSTGHMWTCLKTVSIIYYQNIRAFPPANFVL